MENLIKYLIRYRFDGNSLVEMATVRHTLKSLSSM